LGRAPVSRYGFSSGSIPLTLLLLVSLPPVSLAFSVPKPPAPSDGLAVGEEAVFTGEPVAVTVALGVVTTPDAEVTADAFVGVAAVGVDVDGVAAVADVAAEAVAVADVAAEVAGVVDVAMAAKLWGVLHLKKTYKSI
jgi:hypothetical protein